MNRVEKLWRCHVGSATYHVVATCPDEALDSIRMIDEDFDEGLEQEVLVDPPLPEDALLTFSHLSDFDDLPPSPYTYVDGRYTLPVSSWIEWVLRDAKSSTDCVRVLSCSEWP